jgi:hypothetical protein
MEHPASATPPPVAYHSNTVVSVDDGLPNPHLHVCLIGIPSA